MERAVVLGARLGLVAALVLVALADSHLALAAFVEPADGTTTPATDDGAAEISNTTTMLIGAVLLGGGVWALRNRQRRFPGSQKRDHR